MGLGATLSQIFGLLSILGHGILVIIVFSLVFAKNKFSKLIIKFFGRNAVIFSLIVVILATGGSLTYSNVVGYEACKLCWFQRIFMYPQVILLALALKIRDKNIWIYSITLSLVGAILAGYHYLLQLGIAPSVACSTVGYSVSCVKRFTLIYGYITIPMMALTAFLLIISFFIAQRFLSRIK